MCGGSGPAPPPPAARLPEAPVAPNVDAAKKRKRPGANNGTLLTGPTGLMNSSANTQQATLLGS